MMMRTKSWILLIALFLSCSLKLSAQETRCLCTDSLADTTHKFTYPQLIIPAALIGVGVSGLGSDWLKFQNQEIRNELKETIDDKITIDDFSQYVPLLAVYGLNLSGVKGLHNFRDRTTILATSYLIMGVTVNSLKHLTHEERPDGSSFDSFPSGHTATAFMGAEFLWQEYKQTSPWIGVAGYAVAAGTGAFRIYNNRHWLTDVLAGGGIGILSTKIAYWVYPSIQKRLYRKSKSKKNNVFSNALAVPYYNGESAGVSFQASF